MGEALSYLHSRAPAVVAHHNLKPQKVLLTIGGRDVRLSGFGRARTRAVGSSSSSSSGGGVVGAGGGGGRGDRGGGGIGGEEGRWTVPTEMFCPNLTNLPFLPPDVLMLLQRCFSREPPAAGPTEAVGDSGAAAAVSGGGSNGAAAGGSHGGDVDGDASVEKNAGDGSSNHNGSKGGGGAAAAATAAPVASWSEQLARQRVSDEFDALVATTLSLHDGVAWDR